MLGLWWGFEVCLAASLQSCLFRRAVVGLCRLFALSTATTVIVIFTVAFVALQGVLERLMWHLSSASSPTDAQLFAPAHLAAVLLAEVAPCREVAAEKGASVTC